MVGVVALATLVEVGVASLSLSLSLSLFLLSLSLYLVFFLACFLVHPCLYMSSAQTQQACKPASNVRANPERTANTTYPHFLPSPPQNLN